MPIIPLVCTEKTAYTNPHQNSLSIFFISFVVSPLLFTGGSEELVHADELQIRSAACCCPLLAAAWGRRRWLLPSRGVIRGPFLQLGDIASLLLFHYFFFSSIWLLHWNYRGLNNSIFLSGSIICARFE